MGKKVLNEIFLRKSLMIRCFITFMVFSLTIATQAFAQADKKVTINVQNTLVRTVLDQLQRDTHLHFVYEESTINPTQRVSLNYQNAPLSSILTDFCKQTSLRYEIKRNLILILPQNTTQTNKKHAPIDIAGTVFDENGEGLIGVSVFVPGTNSGTITDVDGHYSIKAAPGDLLTFTFVGMADKAIKITPNTKTLNVNLEPATTALNEVVVTGYQTISKERATGAFDIISKEQLSKPTANIASRLIGTTSGLQATTDINGDPTFEIRGQTSLTANAQPLIVVDGFAIEGDFKSINPNDVESITVLKDAAASSIWGARSANGVIVIVTKKGASDKKKGFNVEVSSFLKVAPKANLDYALSQASSSETLDYEKLAFNKWSCTPIADHVNDYTGYSASYSPGLTALNEQYLGYLSQAETDNILNSYRNLSNREQLKKYILQTPITHQHNINISSQNDRISNILSLMYEGDDYYLKGNSRYKMMVNYRMNAKLFKWLDFNFSGMYNYDKATSNSEGLPDLAPYEMLVNPDGSRANIGYYYYMPNIERYVPTENFPYSNWGYNPITEMENQDKTITQMNARIQAGLRINIINGLSFDSKFQYELYNTLNRDLYNDNTFLVRNTINQAASWNRETNEVTSNLPKGGILDQSRNRIDSWYFRNQLNFNRTFDKHAIAFIAGTEISSRVAQTFTNPRTYGYDDDRLTVGTFPNGPGSGSVADLKIKDWQGQNQTFGYTNSFKYATDRYFSLYGNLSYTFNEKYSLSGSARTDASNLITDDPKYRYSPFWSVGASWQIGKEEFMKELTWLDRLNIRATYGYNGNVDKSTSFKPLITMYSTNNKYTDEPYGSISSYGNPTLRWEKTGTWNIGVDYSILGGKLYGKVDFYNKYTRDLIASLSIPAINGTNTQKLNNAEMRNRGFEIEVGSSLPITRKISWNGNLNVSYNKNKITKLFKASYQSYELVQGGTSAYMEGADANTLWVYEYAGVYNDGTEANPNWQPKIKDNEGNLYDFTAFPNADGRALSLNMGTKVAPWILGFSNNFRIYDFDFSFIMTGKFGHKFMRQSFNYPYVWNSRATPNRQLSEITNCNPMERIPLPLNGDIESRYFFWNRFYPYVSYLTENAGVFRMQEINLTYNMPKNILNKIGLSNLQIYAMVNNVFSIYANSFGEDPEFTRGNLKPQPTYTFGLKFQF